MLLALPRRGPGLLPEMHLLGPGAVNKMPGVMGYPPSGPKAVGHVPAGPRPEQLYPARPQAGRGVDGVTTLPAHGRAFIPARPHAGSGVPGRHVPRNSTPPGPGPGGTSHSRPGGGAARTRGEQPPITSGPK
jgi:hypothetical protein